YQGTRRVNIASIIAQMDTASPAVIEIMQRAYLVNMPATFPTFIAGKGNAGQASAIFTIYSQPTPILHPYIV
ncbi:MAG: hypothetical protein IJ849_07325, partial [Selenomonadaceae bacterium]|nr:hypothetical protein [Selenomonadaceae bacterium]